MSIPNISVRHPVTTTMVFVGLILLGLFSLSRVGQELFPTVDLPTMVVVTTSPGSAPAEVESRITEAVEDAASGINGVSSVSSTSFESVSQVVVQFDDGTDLGSAQVDLREALASVVDTFPDGTEQPFIFRYSASSAPSLVLNVVTSAPQLDLREISTEVIVPTIERVGGVGRVSVFGGTQRAVMVELDLDALIKTGIPITQVANAFGGDNLTLPAGSVDQGDRAVSLRVLGEYQTIDDVGSLLVGYQAGVPIYLREIATISMGTTPDVELATARGEEAVRLTVRKQPDANTVDVNDAVLAAIDRLGSALPDTVIVEVQENQAVSVRNSIGSTVNAAWQGGILAIFILLFFLRNIRSTVIVATVIPVAVIATISLIDFGGMTLNITSLMGITLAIGMFVDNSIVVLESIYRKALAGHDRAEAAILGAEEVSKAVTASTLTSMAVFLPMLFITGLAGELFDDLSLTVAFSLLMSLLAALSFVPMLSAKLLKVTPISKVDDTHDFELSLADVEVQSNNRFVSWMGRGIQQVLRSLDDGYERLIKWAVSHAGLVVGGAFALLALSVGSVLLLGFEFLPSTDEANFSISFETTEGASAGFALEKAREIESIVREVAGVDLRALAGAAGAGGERSASNEGVVSVGLVAADERDRDIWEITREVDRRLAREVMDIDYRTTIIGMSSLAAQASGTSSDVAIELQGNDLELLSSYAAALVEPIDRIPGIRNARSTAQNGTAETRFVIRREAAAELGLSAREVAGALRIAYNGTTASTFSADGEDTDIVVILSEEDRLNLDRVGNLFLVNAAGEQILMDNLIVREDDTAPVSINRDARTRVVRILADLDGTRPLSEITSELDLAIASVGPPPVGIERVVEGASEEMSESFRSLALALAMAIALVYMVMASQFEDFLNPLLVMASVPFAVIGLVGALLATNTTFSIIAFAGMILLVGIVVNNAIVLIDYIDTLRERGLPLVDAIVKGGRTRLKPILMTTMTTVLGLIPMALGIGAGSELLTPMGRAVVGGLLTSTLVTLILIPTLYWLVQGKLKTRIAERKAARTTPSGRSTPLVEPTTARSQG